MTIGLRDVVLAIRYGEASLVAESAGYLVLGAADIAHQSPTIASLDAVSLSEDGSVSLRGAPGTEAESEESLRFLLGQLLENVRAPSPNLERVSARRELRSLRGLIEELEAALVPVNRRAAARTLARLFRETSRSLLQAGHALRVQEVLPAPPVPVTQAVVTHAAHAEAVAAEAVVLQDVAAREEVAGEELVVLPALPQVAVQVTPEKRTPDRAAGSRAEAGVLATMARGFGALSDEEFSLPDALAAADEPLVAESDPEEHISDDGTDEEPTQIFVGTFAPKSSGAYAGPRIDTRARTPIPDEISLIPETPSHRVRRPSDIQALLDKSEVKRNASDELYSGLKTLSRVDLSPLAPPVGASWMENDRN